MTQSDAAVPTSDERMLGALAHIFGALVAIFVWFIQKDKSRFLKFQTLQALVFDMTLFLVSGLLFLCLFGVIILGMSVSMFAMFQDPASTAGLNFLIAFPMFSSFTLFGCALPLSMLFMTLRLIAGISVFQGRNYHYPVIGKWLDGFLDT